MICCTSEDSSQIPRKLVLWALGTINNNFVAIPIYHRICFTDHLSIDRGEIERLEKLFGLLQVKDAAPLVLSQQYDAQQNLPDKVFHVTGWEYAASSF